MNIKYEIIVFLIYIFIGFIISFIFDIFRAIRKSGGKNKKTVYIDDILFFLISGLVIIIANIFYTKEMIRLHLIISIFLGIMIYITAFGNSIMLFIFSSLVKILDFLKFLILPLKFQIELIKKICIFLKKFIKKCCIMFKNMLTCIYNLFKVKILPIKFSKNKGETNESG